MKLKYLLSSLTLVTILGIQNPVIADDIDIFLNNPVTTPDKPNVLFILDNSANWNSNIGAAKKFEMEHEALYNALTDPGLTDKVQVGLMLFTDSNSPKGGKVYQHVQLLDAAQQNNWKSILYDTGLSSGTEMLPQANNAPYALSMNEALLYFKGVAPVSGLADGVYDSITNPEGYDAAAYNAGTGKYNSPSAGQCGKNYVIVVGNGNPDNGEDSTAETALTSHGGKLDDDPIDLTPGGNEHNWADEYARFMASTDTDTTIDGNQSIISYVIDVHDPNVTQNNPFKSARAWLKSIAIKGKGKYYTAENTGDIAVALTEIFDEIQAANSVFASTTLPVSVNVRGTNLNQVYMGVFRPDGQAFPHWFGNLKLYQLAVDTSIDPPVVYLADSNGLAAQSSEGFIVGNAVSYWTTPSTFWDFSPRGTPESGSDAPDGEVVEKGATAQQMREDYPTRNLYTCTGTCGSSSSLSGTVFATSNADITQAALGAADSTERSDIINWLRGEDNMDEDGDSVTNEVRPSIHGDVLHSRPAVINYNRYGNDDDVITYYGSNDGVFHAVKGGKAAGGGEELWGFVPQEFFGKLKRLRDNSPKVKTLMNPLNPAKDYFVDGTVSVYQKDTNNDGTLDYTDGDKVYLYLSMRRGGQLLYALDASNPTNPKLLWNRSNTDTGYGELGQSWSAPTVASINLNGTPTPVLIMGAGYDSTADDAEPAGVATMGRGVLVVDALNGNVIWQAGPSPAGSTYTKTVADMTYGIPSDVTVLNRDGDASGYADRLYVGDTGGQLWRINIGDPDPNNWTVDKLASIAGAGNDARKFLYAPDVVYGSGYDAVLIGSGDREHPFNNSIVNRFYMFKDTGGATIHEGDLYDVTANLIQVGNTAEQAAAATALANASGWYITLGTGEKVVGNAVTLNGSTFFNTNQPSAILAACSNNLGIARTYIVSYEDARATTELDQVAGINTSDRSTTVPGGGYPPPPVPVIVEIDDKKYEAVISGTDVKTSPGSTLETRRRVFWYKEIE